ncbi:hypothetical protein GCM10027605_14200 [Micromonospora zhanjiangensis]
MPLLYIRYTSPTLVPSGAVIDRWPSLTLAQEPPKSVAQACAALYGLLAAWAGEASATVATAAAVIEMASRRATLRTRSSTVIRRGNPRGGHHRPTERIIHVRVPHGTRVRAVVSMSGRAAPPRPATDVRW